MTHRVSLCICTMNRPEELRRCLKSLSGSSVQPAEVLVSDDSRGDLADRTKSVVAEFPQARYLRGPATGLSANRNSVLDNVKGDLVAFLDDDQSVHPSFLADALENYDRLCRTHGTPRIIVTGSQTLPGGPLPPSNLNFLGFYTGIVPQQDNAETVVLGCALFPAAVFSEVRFDENFAFGSEDSDLSYHATYLGYRIFYIQSLTNYHAPSRINRDLYDDVLLQCRLYFGLKRYWLYRRSLPKFLLFNVYGLANAVGHCLKHLNVRGAFAAFRSYLTAWSLFLSRLRQIRAGT
jgi:glycosyltransferase involved in cell wall biosynthesis